MPTKNGEFTKHDSGKPRTDLLPPLAIMEVAKVLAFGAKKYDDHNWNKCTDKNRYTAAELRHVFEDLAAQLYPDLFDRTDEESKIIKLAHAACDALFELELVLVERMRNASSKEKKIDFTKEDSYPYVKEETCCSRDKEEITTTGRSLPC